MLLLLFHISKDIWLLSVQILWFLNHKFLKAKHCIYLYSSWVQAWYQLCNQDCWAWAKPELSELDLGWMNKWEVGKDSVLVLVLPQKAAVPSWVVYPKLQYLSFSISKMGIVVLHLSLITDGMRKCEACREQVWSQAQPEMSLRNHSCSFFRQCHEN
jgi:hypothetical protein